MQSSIPKYGNRAVRAQITTFKGLNVTDRGGESFSKTTTSGSTTFSDMVNGGTDAYPFAASRLPRSFSARGGTALYGGEKLAICEPPYLRYGEEQIDIGLSDGQKEIVGFGAYLLIFPDQKFYNTVTGEYGDMDHGKEVPIPEKTLSGSSSDSLFLYVDGVLIKSGTSERTVPVEFRFTDKTYTRNAYVALDNYYIRNAGSDTFSVASSAAAPLVLDWIVFGQKDGYLYYLESADCDKAIGTASSVTGATFTNCVWKKLNVTSVIFSVPKADYADVNFSAVWRGDTKVHIRVTEGGTNLNLEITNPDILNAVPIQSYLSYGHWKAFVSGSGWRTRTMPLFDHVTVCANRLFGCRKGTQYDADETINRIYVSKLGTFDEFETFAGISTDSYFAEIGDPGEFTGAVTYGEHPIFFKEDRMYIVYGDYPPYTVSRISIRGVAQGAARSLLTVNNVLLWKSRHDIMAYTSSSCSSVSAPLGKLSDVQNAVAGTWRGKYYVALDGVLYAYDTESGLWAKEDALAVTDFAEQGGILYALADGNLYTFGDSDAEESFAWSLTSPVIGYAYPNRKFVSKLLFRIELGEPSALPAVELSFDGEPFEEATVKADFKDRSGNRSGTMLVPIRPRRCETFRWRISGTGAYKLTGVTRMIEESGK